jgi:stage VI sporulation protein D
MTNRSDSKLRFSIEESVWLRNGQEVAEVLSMSLNPEISIEEVNDQILIKGYLYLTGEYRPATESEETNDFKEGSLKDQLQYRSLDQINESEDGVLELEHRFPVDITIPKQRIQNVDEVYVNVESFDYDLPSYNCVELTADIAITGIKQDGPQASSDEVNDVDEAVDDKVPQMVRGSTEPPSDQRTFEEFEFEARKASEDNEDDVKVQESRGHQPPLVEMKGREYSSNYENSQNDDESYEIDRDDSYISPLKSLSSDGTEDDDQQEAQSEKYYNNEGDYEVEDQDVNEEEYQVNRDENALYLTSILAREEEEFSRLKMCITQPGESLEEIASKYEVSTSHLVRVNRLDHEEITEGQILYIPIPAGRP